MKLNYYYDGNIACKRILEDHLDKLNIEYHILGLSQIEINDDLSLENFEKLQLELDQYAIHIINNPKAQLIQTIKDIIVEIIYEKDKFPSTTISQYLSEKLDLRYGYITTVFSEYTYTSVENFIIIQKIERAKKLILAEKLSLTEISYELNYSSVAYLSTQFKKVTGLTPSMFKRIVDKKRLLSKKKIK